jgi:hypothetical protein
LNNSGGLGTASFIELPGVWLWRSAPRVDRILYSSFRANHRKSDANRSGPRRSGAALRNSGATGRTGIRALAPPWCNERVTAFCERRFGACTPFCTFLVNPCAVHAAGPRTDVRAAPAR